MLGVLLIASHGSHHADRQGETVVAKRIYVSSRIRLSAEAYQYLGITDQIIKDILERGIKSLKSRIYVKLMHMAERFYEAFPAFVRWIFGVNVSKLDTAPEYNVPSGRGDAVGVFKDIYRYKPRLQVTHRLRLRRWPDFMFILLPALVVLSGISLVLLQNLPENFSGEIISFVVAALVGLVYARLINNAFDLVSGALRSKMEQAAQARYVAENKLWQAEMKLAVIRLINVASNSQPQGRAESAKLHKLRIIGILYGLKYELKDVYASIGQEGKEMEDGKLTQEAKCYRFLMKL